MIKSILVSDDESVVCTGGSDGTVKLWDIGQRAVIQTYGEDKKLAKKYKQGGFHTDTVFQVMQTPSQQIFSTGRDGSIF